MARQPDKSANRTNVELKQKYINIGEDISKSANRTNVELKQRIKPCQCTDGKC